MDENPYRAPVEVGYDPPHGTRTFVGRAGGGRFLAAQIDHGFGMVIFLAVGMNVVETVGNIPAGIAALTAYLGYYFLPEWFFGATLGKALFSLRVRQISGASCTARQIAVRTAMRILEVNPLRRCVGREQDGNR